MIDGVEQASYTAPVARGFCLTGKAGEEEITVRLKLKLLGGTISISCGEQLLAERFHL